MWIHTACTRLEIGSAPVADQPVRSRGSGVHAGGMSYEDDAEAYKRRLNEKLEPSRIRSTLAFAGLYQVTHELIKEAVVEGTKNFFGYNPYVREWLGNGQADYQKSVLSLAPNTLRASLLWLVSMHALTSVQADRLDEIYAHRHQLTHELTKYLVDVDHEPDQELFVDALTILTDVHRLWTQIEIDTGSIELPEGCTIDDVTPGTIALLGACVSAYYEDGLRSD